MIDVLDLSFGYPDGTLVFEGFSWHVGEGEAWAVLGPSGCGKTTLLYLLAGLRRPSAGEILIAGEPLGRPRPRTGLILQDFGLLPWATVRENAALGLRVRGLYGPDGTHAPREASGVPADDAAVRARVDPWLERLGLDLVSGNFPAQISGGQRQRTAIARTFVLGPDLLLMDEPFAALDAPTRESLQNLTLQLRDENGLTTVVVTHTIEEAALLGQHVLLLGRLPNREARTVANPGGGRPEFREDEGYTAACARLRQALEAVA
jgi:NitT/TauT family transport system ATP-binding protein